MWLQGKRILANADNNTQRKLGIANSRVMIRVSDGVVSVAETARNNPATKTLRPRAAELVNHANATRRSKTELVAASALLAGPLAGVLATTVKPDPKDTWYLKIKDTTGADFAFRLRNKNDGLFMKRHILRQMKK